MRYKAGIQIILIVISVIIIFTVIRPKLTSVKVMQDDISLYKSVIANVSEYNQVLQDKLNTIANVSAENTAMLNRFLPTEIDAVRVSRDIQNIVNNFENVVIEDITVGPIEPVAVLDTTTVPVDFEDTLVEADPTAIPDPVVADIPMVDSMNTDTDGEQLLEQSFELSLLGSYQDIKAVLQDFERNAYPLTITNFSFEYDDESPFQSYKVTLKTYAYGVLPITSDDTNQ